MSCGRCKRGPARSSRRRNALRGARAPAATGSSLARLGIFLGPYWAVGYTTHTPARLSPETTDEEATRARNGHAAGVRLRGPIRPRRSKLDRQTLARSRWRASSMHEGMHPCGFLARPRQTPTAESACGAIFLVAAFSHHQRRPMRAAQHTGVRTLWLGAGRRRHCLTSPAARGLVRLLGARGRRPAFEKAAARRP